MHLIVRLEALPRPVSITMGMALVGMVGILDYVTGYQLSFSAFYLLPIFVLAWLGGSWPGYAGAAASTAARTLADMLGGNPYSTFWFPVWNAGMRLGLYLVVALLISTIRRYVEHERALARIDHLTGAANKRAFTELAKSELDRSRRYRRPFTLAYFDLDNFKFINDTLGHGAGDELLQSVVSVIREHIRAPDTVARVGGDEFVLLLPETDETAAKAAIAKIRSRFADEMKAHDWPVTMCIGALTCLAGQESVEQLLVKADHLMYEAKMKGKNAAVFAAEPPSG